MSVIKGDPYGEVKDDKKDPRPSAKTVNEFHARSDVDSSVTAQHHTLGIKHDQASPGDHNHDGKGSRLIGEGLSITISGSKGGNAALASLITALKQVMAFTDNTS